MNLEKLKWKRIPLWIRITCIYCLVISLINGIYFFGMWAGIDTIEEMDYNGMMFKIKPLNRAYVVSHGSYRLDENGDYYHYSYYYDGLKTIDLVNQLKEEGYNYVWLGQCQTGNHNFIMRYANGTEIEWPEWVDRYHKPGTIGVIFIGPGFIRIPWEG